MSKFWRWKNEANKGARVLRFDGVIADESWFSDDLTPQVFRDELFSGHGDLEIWLNSPGGDCVAAAQIYNMLMDYKGDVTVIVDGIAASAASVIAMAGTKVLMSPVSMMMIHNPSTLAWGESADFAQAASMLDAVKESIINAYEIKTGLSRAQLAEMMDAETWMDANKAVELGFADGVYTPQPQESQNELNGMMFARRSSEASLMRKLVAKAQAQRNLSLDRYYARLKDLKDFKQ